MNRNEGTTQRTSARKIGVLQTNRLASVKNFAESKFKLAIVTREEPEGATEFFRALVEHEFEEEIMGVVRKQFAKEDILFLIEDHIPEELQENPFFDFWVNDMASISKLFCDVEGAQEISFSLDTERGCKFYHTDNVPRRLLVTYLGKGTEWLPDDKVDREAFAKAKPSPYNSKFLKDKSAINYMNQWDVSIFCGGPDGIIHRTPDEASSTANILLRLDSISFYEQLTRAEMELESSEEDASITQ